MKKTLIIPYLMLGVLFFAGGCKKYSGDYTKYLDNAEAIYPGKPVSLVINSGINRAQVLALISPDPRVVKVRIYWNNGRDSVDADISKADLAKNKTIMIPSIPEGIYSFQAVSFDAAGHRSVVTEKNGSIFGQNYIRTLVNRVYKAKITVSGTTGIQWFSETDTASAMVGVRVYYPLNNGSTASVFTAKNRDTTLLTNAKAGQKFIFKTAYIPKGAIDTFYSKTDTLAY